VSIRFRAELALATVTLVWGTSFTLIHAALEDASTLLFVGVRFLLAALLVGALYRRALVRAWATSLRPFRGGVLAGCCLTAAYLCQTAGLRYTTPSKSAFLTSLCVVLVPFLGCLVYRRVPRSAEILGIALAMTGMAFLTLPAGWRSWQEGFNRGDVLTAGCALAFAAHILLVGELVKTTAFEVLSATQLGAVAVLSLAGSPWFEVPRFQFSPRLTLALAVTALLCTALAYSVQAWAQQHTSPTRAALIFALEPVVAAFTSWLAIGERLTVRGWFGAALILSSVLVVELKPRLRAGHPK
jgi:drug/metabolite transporter (DMT)-like permease